MERKLEIYQLLTAIEETLKATEKWQYDEIEATILLSQEPFCLDTLDGTEWLQWVFLPKMRQLLDNGDSMPERLELVPYFEEVLDVGASELLSILSKLDKLFKKSEL